MWIVSLLNNIKSYFSGDLTESELKKIDIEVRDEMKRHLTVRKCVCCNNHCGYYIETKYLIDLLCNECRNDAINEHYIINKEIEITLEEHISNKMLIEKLVNL